MHNIPVEILSDILGHLLVYHRTSTERFASITNESRRDVLNARMVCHAFHGSKAMQDAFISVLEETMLFSVSLHTGRMRAIATSKYAPSMSMVTFPAFPWSDLSEIRNREDLGSEAFGRLSSVMASFHHVRHVRFCYLEECFVKERNEPHREERYEGGDPRQSSYLAWCLQGHIVWILNALDRHSCTPDIVESSLRGSSGRSAMILPWRLKILEFSASLKHLSINTRFDDREWVLDQWLSDFQSLQYLEISLPECLGDELDPPIDQLTMLPWWHGKPGRAAIRTLPKLKTFRFSAVHDCFFPAQEFLTMLELFPALENLGLANILLADPNVATWSSLLATIKDRNFRAVQLIFPGYRKLNDGPIRGDELGVGDEVLEPKSAKGVSIKRFSSGVEVVPMECRELWGKRTLVLGEEAHVLGFGIFDDEMTVVKQKETQLSSDRQDALP